jgi:Mn2+/Fe2+ NRAMP family transporter
MSVMILGVVNMVLYAQKPKSELFQATFAFFKFFDSRAFGIAVAAVGHIVTPANWFINRIACANATLKF